MGFTASFCLESSGVLTIWFSLSSISIFTERLLFLIRWSNQEPDLPSHFKQLKKIGEGRERMKWWFLDIRDSGERRSMQLELLLGRGFWVMAPGRGMQVEPNDRPAIRTGSGSSNRTRVRDCREGSMERRVAWCMIPIVHRGTPQAAAEYWPVCACEENTWSLGKNHPEGAGGSIVRAHTRLGWFVFLQNKVENNHNIQRIRKGKSVGQFCFNSGENTSHTKCCSGSV